MSYFLHFPDNFISYGSIKTPSLVQFGDEGPWINHPTGLTN